MWDGLPLIEVDWGVGVPAVEDPVGKKVKSEFQSLYGMDGLYPLVPVTI